MNNIRFLSRVLASSTHEMQNIMAIINESAGLGGDVLRLNGPPRLKHGDKLFEALDTVAVQVERGRQLMDALNVCAHAASAEYELLDLNHFCAYTAQLAERMARLGECRLVFTPNAQKLFVRADGYVFMQGLHRAVELVLDCCLPGREISLSLLPAPERQEVALLVRAGAVKPGQSLKADKRLDELASSLGARISYDAEALSLNFGLAQKGQGAA